MNSVLEPALVDLLVCPGCGEPITEQDAGVACGRCRRLFPIRSGVLDLRLEPGPAMPLDSSGRVRNPAAPQRAGYGSRAARRNRLELHILTHMLSTQPASRTLLDVSCRRGRFSGPMQSAARLLIEADADPGSARAALDDALNPPRVAALACDPERLPFAERGLDGVVCIRLSHHIGEASRRGRILEESLRVAERFVVFSFSQSVSIPAAWRRIRGRGTTVNAMNPDEVADIAGRHGAHIADSITVSPLGTRHRFVLLEKTGR